MYVITETGTKPYIVSNEAQVVQYALDYAWKHGNYSGMEDWDEDNMRHWIRITLEQASPADDKILDLYISGPEGREFVVRAG